MIDDELIEQLARAVHENYVREQLSDGVKIDSRPSMCAWDDLDEDLREANRAQARAIADKIREVGANVVPAEQVEEAFAFTDDEVERLARGEYVRWAAQRTAAGWVYGRKRNDRKKVHPSLCGWERLDEVERDKDRDAVRNIPGVLAHVGLAVSRQS
jgi:hypothetical protein